VLALCGTALADNYDYQRVPRDNAAAAAITIRAADLPKQLRLTGGRIKPDETPNSDSCNGYRPKAAEDVKRQLPLLAAACSKQVAAQEHVKLFSYKVLGPARCPCDDSLSLVIETATKNPAVHLLMIVTVMRRGRIEASVMTGVGRSTTDKSNLALRDAVAIQNLAISALAKHLQPGA
jgi:hypothetical protein